MTRSDQRPVFVSYALADRTQIKKLLNELRVLGVVGQNDELIDHVKILMQAATETAEDGQVHGSDLIGATRSRIREAIKDVSKVIVIWSSGGAESQWVNYETAMANALGKEVIVIVPKGERSQIPDQIAENRIVEIDSVH